MTHIKENKPMKLCRKLLLLAGVVAVFSTAAMAQTGNGSVSGPHYNLNLLGKKDCTPADLTGSNRRNIQVLLNYSDGSQTGQTVSSLDKRNKIFLQEGDFQVIDGNACDGATF